VGESVFAGRLRELREAARLTQKQLADKAGLALSGLTHLEQGLREPTWATVQALADALGVSCDAFRKEAAERAPQGRGRPPRAEHLDAPERARGERRKAEPPDPTPIPQKAPRPSRGA
jgi:transcriptional regulator with XRE-family HTH domain